MHIRWNVWIEQQRVLRFINHKGWLADMSTDGDYDNMI